MTYTWQKPLLNDCMEVNVFHHIPTVPTMGEVVADTSHMQYHGCIRQRLEINKWQ